MLRCSLCNRRVIVWYELKSSQFHFEMSESVTPTGRAVSNSEFTSREPYIRGVLPSNFLYNEIRIFLDQLSYSDLLRYPPDFIFPCWIIFFCFLVSGTVQNCPENGKNRREIKWLLMAPPKIFRVARAFLFLEIFQKLFFSKCPA